MGKSGRSSGSGDLHEAARAGDLSTVHSICVSNPLAINSRDRHSRTPLHLAAWAGREQVVSFLCKHGADVGAAAADDVGALHFAAQKGHLEAVRALLAHGASAGAASRKGMTALHYAAQGSHAALVRYLVKKRSSLLGARTRAGKTAADIAGSEEIRSLLLGLRRGSESDDEEERYGGDSDLKPPPPPTMSSLAAWPAEDPEAGWAVAERKRVADEDGPVEAISIGPASQPKRAKVALGHLVSTDDTQDQDGEHEE